MNNKIKHTALSKGLFGVLCLIIAVTTNCENVRAESTTDDLKAYLGITVDKTDEEREYSSNYSDVYGDKNDEHLEKDEKTDPIDIAKENLAKFIAELNQYMSDDASGFVILDTINSIKTKKTEIEALGYETKYTELNNDSDESNSEKKSSILTVYKSSNDISSRYYDIGDIGDNLKFCITPFEIDIPYGYEVSKEYTYEDSTEEPVEIIESTETNEVNQEESIDSTETPEESIEQHDRYTTEINYSIIGNKHTSLTLKASENTEVKALFNGRIYSIEKDKACKDAYNISIFHGNGVYTIYRHITLTDDIKKYSMIKQYDILGTVAKNESNEYKLDIQLVVDKMYINPLLLFGHSGKDIYEKFLLQTDKTYSVESNEYYYYDDSMSVENPNKE